MKRIRSILRGREGMTLVELVVGAGLLCLVIGIFSASLRPEERAERNSEEAMEKVAEIPVIRPDRATKRLSCRAKVSPARVPVSSTSASFNPSTMEPT